MAFREEFLALKDKAPISTKSRLLKLTPFLDDNELMRVGGRLRNSSMGYTRKHPLLLPRNHPFTSLSIAAAHSSTLHGGAQVTLTYLRRDYWIIDARNQVRKFIKSCLTCFRYMSEPATQLMGDLPTPRVMPNRPFLHSGVDYAGPIDVRTSKGRGNKSHKAYIAVFVCFSTKAVHLELVSDLSAHGFLAAFRRFVSRRGICSDLYSDQGTNFVGAKTILRQMLNSTKRQLDDIINTFSMLGTQWHFNPPAAPHHGGLWEAAVKAAKHHLRHVIGTTTLTYEEMSTLLCQIEACLNSRPLYSISQDPTDCEALTPGHFLIGAPLLAVPEPNVLDIQQNRLSRWQLVQQMTQHFWKRWSSEYLNTMQQRTKWQQTKVNVNVGDMILLRDDRLPPCSWSLGRIIATHPGSDGNTRVVTIKCHGSIFKRPITRICVLPSNNEADK